MGIATLADYEARWGPVAAGLESRTEQLLDDASAAALRKSGPLERATTTTRIRVVGGRIILPRRPVTAVTTINAIYDGNVSAPLVGWTFDGIDTISGLYPRLVINAPEHSGPVRLVDVTYTAGHDPVPDDVIAIVCAAVNRILDGPDPSLAGETIGDYSYRVASGAPGRLGFTADEITTLTSFRRPARSVPIG